LVSLHTQNTQSPLPFINGRRRNEVVSALERLVDRKLQGIIHGQRGGVTENLGAAAVKRWKKSQQPELPDDSSQHASRVGFAQNLLKE
jgi:hypothetical protein